jgi:hypothetical protein
MKLIDVEQGSPEWMDARLGMPTASQFHKIITEKRHDYSAAAEGYRNQLLAEEMLGRPTDDESWSRWMERGSELEAESIRAYEFQRDVSVDRVGFVTNDAGTVGCSPDGLVGDDGGLESKSYGVKHHVACLLGQEVAKVTQVQGGIWVCERDWWDTQAYCPGMPPVLIRVYRDDVFLKKLADCMARFLDELAKGREVLKALGNRGRTDSLEALLGASVT